MERLFIIALILSGAVLSAACRKLHESQVPVTVKTASERKYPGIKAHWTKMQIPKATLNRMERLCQQ